MQQRWNATISKQTLADQVAEHIVSMIASGALKKGDALPSQREIAREMGVSLPAVREAIQRLQMLRVVHTAQGSGMVVGEVGWQQIVLEPSLQLVALEGDALRHMWEARHAIENQVARLAALRATPEDIAAIKAVIDRAGPYLETYEANRELNFAFHIALAQAAKNPILEEMLESLLGVDLSAARKIFSPELSQHSWKIHRKIYDAVVRRDPTAAILAMEEHAAALDAEMLEVDLIVHGGEGAARPAKARRPRARSKARA